MNSERFILLWLQAGLVWFFVAMATSPTNKLYQQGLVLLFWLPALIAAFTFRKEFRTTVRERWVVFLMMGALLLWVACSLGWSDVENPAQRAKRLLYVVLFCVGMGALALRGEKTLERLLLGLSTIMAALALWHIYQYYIVSDTSWTSRLHPNTQIGHPILGGYVMGVCAVIVISALENAPKRLTICATAAIIALISFMALTQSRGVMLALILTVVLFPIAKPSKAGYAAAATLIATALLGYFFLEPFITSRGFSYRPEIALESLRMIFESPIAGVGLSGEYVVTPPEYPGKSFVHSHNLFLHVGIESGLPALILLATIWLCMGRDAWRYRHSGLGSTLLAVWTYATVAVMFDVASFWDPPRSTWMVTWFPIGLWIATMVSRHQQTAS